ncbi:hypothetical protein DL768_000262 [Monosporascus sp. mg162]|nr:hypothetical protein DL768_000262 [Monosporascus sp. mg162]
MLAAQIPSGSQSPGQMGRGTSPYTQVLRAQVAVSHLSISQATSADKSSPLPFISEDTKTPSTRVFLAILASEITGVGVALGVFIAFRSPWALLWLMPLLVRFISAIFALHREQLVSSVSSSAVDDPPHDFEIHCPQSEGNFMLLSGPPALVLQFFRHYGHPKRDRLREVVQLLCVIISGCQFPAELLCSMIWMPSEIQNIWLAYHLYVVIAMHVSRYCYIGHSATTEAKIAEAFAKQVCEKVASATTRKASILFGHQRDGLQTLKVDLSVTYHGRNKEGRDKMEELLHPAFSKA